MFAWIFIYGIRKEGISIKSRDHIDNKTTEGVSCMYKINIHMV